MPEKININQVEPGSTIMIAGDLVFSRLISKISGDELEKRNERARTMGMPTQEKPYTTVTLKNAQIITKDPNGTLDTAEQYVRGLLYKSQNPQREGWNFSIDDKSYTLPALGHKTPEGDVVQFHPKRDLAAGQRVIVVIRIYGTRLSNGKSIETVIVDSTDPQLFEAGGNQLVTDLAQYGITFKPTTDPADLETDTPAEEVRTLDTTVVETFQAEPYTPVEAAAPTAVEEDAPVAARPGIVFQQ